MALRGPSNGVTRRRPPPEVTYLTAGQLPRPELTDAVEATEAEPVSQVRPCWPGKGEIAQLFVEAGRRR